MQWLIEKKKHKRVDGEESTFQSVNNGTVRTKKLKINPLLLFRRPKKENRKERTAQIGEGCVNI